MLFLIISLSIFAQDRNNVWCFGDSAGIDFTNLNNPVPIISGMDGRGSCASIADTNGNLLFYSATMPYFGASTSWATQVFNIQTQIMQGYDSITGEAWYNELIILPRPNYFNQFYLFCAGVYASVNQGFYKSLIDMNLNGGLGQVISQNVSINSQNHSDCLNAIKHGNGRDWWVMGKYNSGATTSYNRFFVYLVTNDSVYPPLIQDFNDASDGDLQKIIFNSHGNRLMLIGGTGIMCQYSFDRCTGLISNPQVIFPEQPGNYSRLFWEGAYSPNDSVFYVSKLWWPNFPEEYLLQYNLTAANIPASCDTLETFQSPIETGAVRLAPDGKIYFSRAYECNQSPYCYPYPDSARNYVNENLSVINQPNNIGAACDYHPFSFYLGGKRTYYGLPNNPNYSLGPLAGSPCDTLGVATSEIEKQKVLDVFPNPFYNKIQLHFNTSKPKDGELRVLDLTGKQILKKKIQLSNQALDLSSLTGGSYLLEIKTSEFVVIRKLIKLN